MNKSNVFVLGLNLMLLLSACSHKNNTANHHANWKDSTFKSDTMVVDTANRPGEYCFISLGGPQQRDSSYVNLSILDNRVIGKHSWVPFEKDSRTGSIEGTKRGDTIDVVWHFMQEGMKDTLRTVFLLKNNVLKQKAFSVDPNSGRQVTDDKSKFTVTYKRIDCKR